jgi:voltage-gated potassium channel
VVNPQELGAQRMASFVAQPNVADYVDIVMHERDRTFRLQEVSVPSGSPVDGQTLGHLDLRSSTGAMVFAVRSPDGSFVTNPDPALRITAGHVLIAIGSDQHLAALETRVSG